MEISGEDDQTNSAGARSTGRDLQQQQEWWTQTHLPDDQTQEQDWWNQTHVPSRQVGEQQRSEQWPALADSSETPGQSVQLSPPMPLQLMNTPSHSGEHSESNVPDHLWDWWNDDQQWQSLQVHPKNNADSWNQHGNVASSAGHQQNHRWEWSRWNVNDWNQWTSWSARGNDDGWLSRSQWKSEPKKYFDNTEAVVEHHWCPF